MNKFGNILQSMGIVLTATSLFLLISTSMIEILIPLNQEQVILAAKATTDGILACAFSIGVLTLGIVLRKIYD